MNKTDFLNGLEYALEKMPNHALIPSIKRGYNRVNAHYLSKVLLDIEDAKAQTSIAIVTTKKVDNSTIISTVDEVYNSISKIISTLFSERAKMSNKFHDCLDDNERARVSMKISNIQSEIKKQLDRRDHYRKTGQLSEDHHSEKYEVPNDPIKLIGKRNSLRSSISRLKKQLLMLAASPEDHPGRKKIKEKEEQLREKEIHLMHVQKAIK